jgi:hypothetical protein
MPIATKVVSLNPIHGDVYSIQLYVIKLVSDLLKVGGFLRVSRFPPPNKTDCHDITEILLKVVLNTINQPTIQNMTEFHEIHDKNKNIMTISTSLMFKIS